MRTALHFLGALLSLSSPTFPGDWPQFRGPGGTGVSEEKGLPSRWTRVKLTEYLYLSAR